MNFWTGLFPSNERKQLEDGVATMLKISNDLLAVQRRSNAGGSNADGHLMRLEDRQEDSEDYH